MVVLDATIVNIALPSAQQALGFANSDRQWVVTAYALAFGSLLLVGGRLGDMFSRKWVFITGLIGFAIASAIGGAAGSFVILVSGPGAAGRVRRPPRAVGPGHPGQHVPGSARAGEGLRRLRLGRGRRRRRRADPGRRAHPVPLVALVPVRQPGVRRDRRGRRPGLHPRRPAGRPAADGLARRRAGLRRAVPHRLRFLPRRDRRLDGRADPRLSGRWAWCCSPGSFSPSSGPPPAAAAAGDRGPDPGRLLCRPLHIRDRDLRHLLVPHLLPAGGQGREPADDRAAVPADDRLHPDQLQPVQHRLAWDRAS